MWEFYQDRLGQVACQVSGQLWPGNPPVYTLVVVSLPQSLTHLR